MHFLELKNTAHPQFTGALSHSNECISKDNKKAAAKIQQQQILRPQIEQQWIQNSDPVTMNPTTMDPDPTKWI